MIVAGYCPSWVQNVTAVPVRRIPNKFDAIETNVRAALDVDDLTDEVVYFNDDFYVMQAVDSVPVTHGGRAADYRGVQELKWRMNKTITEFIRVGMQVQFNGFLSYDGVHMPLPVNVERARLALTSAPKRILWRTWYGNVACIGGEEVADTKNRGGLIAGGPFLSSSPRAFKSLQPYLEDTLPRKSPYVI